MSAAVGSLMTALVFMLVSKPTNNWDGNGMASLTAIYRCKDTVKITTVGIYGRMPVKSQTPGKKKEHLLHMLYKTQADCMCLSHLSAETLPPW